MFFVGCEVVRVDESWPGYGKRLEADAECELTEESDLYSGVGIASFKQKAVKRLCFRCMKSINFDVTRIERIARERAASGIQAGGVLANCGVQVQCEKLVCRLQRYDRIEKRTIKGRLNTFDFPLDHVERWQEIYSSVFWGFVELLKNMSDRCIVVVLATEHLLDRLRR